MNNINIIWVDDEIDLLKPHILFVEKRNYVVTTCQSGTEAIEIIEDQNFDIVFLLTPFFSNIKINFLNYNINILTILCLYLFIAAMGKSAQIGLHT